VTTRTDGTLPSPPPTTAQLRRKRHVHHLCRRPLLHHDQSVRQKERFAGTRKATSTHLAACLNYSRVGAENMVTFTSEEEARRAGYHKAKKCS
jgi:hypothetical protein